MGPIHLVWNDSWRVNNSLPFAEKAYMCGSKPMLVGVHVALSRINAPVENSLFSFDPRVGFAVGGLAFVSHPGHLQATSRTPVLFKRHLPSMDFASHIGQIQPQVAFASHEWQAKEKEGVWGLC